MTKLSILTAAYNGARFLPDLIESLQSQTFTDWEHIIINDGSTDDGRTERCLQQYPHLRWWSKENSGQYDTQNQLLEAATGEIVTIINQDDFYASPDVLEAAISRFDAEDRPDVVYGDINYANLEGAILPYRYAIVGERSRFLLRNVSCVFHIALFVRRSLIQENQLFFDPAYKMAGDWEWNLRLYKAAQSVAYVNKTIASFRVHSSQKTMSVGESGFKPEVIRICRKHGIPRWRNALLRGYIDWKTRLMSYLRIVKLEGPGGAARRFWHKVRGSNKPEDTG